MALNKVEYSTYNSLWTRIGIFLLDMTKLKTLEKIKLYITTLLQ